MTLALLSKINSGYRKLIPGLISSLFIIIVWPGSILANGGTILLVEEIEAYELTVTASPYPLKVGVNDISVLLGRRADSQIVLNADVMMTAEPVDSPGQSQAFPATHANATNKLYYAANVDFPTPGRWQLTIQVSGPEGPANTVFEIEVVHGSLTSLEVGGLAFVVFLLLLFVILKLRSGEGFGDNPEGDDL